MKPVRYHRLARQEIDLIAKYYRAINLQLGIDFARELERILGLIQANPQMYAIEQANLRLAPMRRFRYSIIYKELPDQI